MASRLCADWYILVVAVPVRRAMRLLAAATVADFSRASSGVWLARVLVGGVDYSCS